MKATGSETWSVRKLGEFFQLKHGYAFKGEFFSESGPYIVLTPGNFFDEGGFKNKEKEKYYTGDIPNGFILSRGDLLVAMTEQKYGLLGSPAIIPENNLYLHNQRLGLISELKVEELEKGYLFYLFKSYGVRAQIQATANGAKVRHTSPARIYDVEVNIPPLQTQRKIASILSAYDDLIKNNLRRIKILEEMAQALYREWFVKFRFPGHEKVRMVDSTLGKIPEGWEVKRLGDAFWIVLGGTPSRNNLEFWRNGTVPWINSGKVNDLRVTEPSELITELALKKSAAKLMPPGTTLIAITGATLGQVSFLEIQASANQSVVGVISEDDNLIEWLHLTIIEKISGIINRASGGAQQHINKGIVDDVVVAVPPRNTAEDFRNIAHPLYRQIAGLLFKNTILRQTRDLLLPRLISGELDVSDLKINIPEEVV